jgi:large subunit ribosomal protein L20
MPRAKRGNKRLEKRKKLEKLSKGYYANKSKLYRAMKEAVERGLKFAYVGRKLKKRDYRSLWIVRIGAAARENGLNYSRFMHGLALAGIELDRKLLADLATTQPAAFAELAASAKKALNGEGGKGRAPKSAPATKSPAVAAPVTAKLASASTQVPETATTAPLAEDRQSDLIEIEGIGPAYEKKLNSAGVSTRAELIEKGATAGARKALAESAGIKEALLTSWVSQADLSRVDGLSDQDAEILVAAGVGSVQALAAVGADEVIAKMTEINAEKNLVKEIPTAEQLGQWAAQAKDLPALVAE